MNKNQSCRTCIFYEITPNNLQGGICRRLPPTTIALPAKGPFPGQARILIRAFYPPIKRSDVGCGEYREDYNIEEGNGED